MNTLVEKHEPYTLQQAFDRAWQWANTHERCTILSGNTSLCGYRDRDNINACLIGCMIPDEDVSKLRDTNYSVSGMQHVSLIFEVIERQFAFNCHEHISVLSSLQSCHDIAANKEDVLSNLTAFAGRNFLTIPKNSA